MARTERAKMLAGELYNPADADLQAELEATQQWLAGLLQRRPGQIDV